MKERKLMNELNEKTGKMSKGQLIYNVVSGLAIVALFVLIFIKMNPSGSSKNVSNDGSPTNIAYVNSDSLMGSYVLVDTLMANLQRVNDSLQKDLQSRQQGFQARVNAYQQNLQNGTIQTVDQAKQQENALQAEQENLMNLSDQYTNKVAVLQAQMNYQIIDSVQSVINLNRDAFPYDVVLGYTKGAGILYVSEDLDITDQILEVLNGNYSE